MKASQINSRQDYINYLARVAPYVFQSYQSMAIPSMAKKDSSTPTTLDIFGVLQACQQVNIAFRKDPRTASFLSSYKNRREVLEQYEDFLQIEATLVSCNKRWMWVKMPSATFAFSTQEVIERNILHWQEEDKKERAVAADAPPTVNSPVSQVVSSTDAAPAVEEVANV